jgi:hypothetical protein
MDSAICFSGKSLPKGRRQYKAIIYIYIYMYTHTYILLLWISVPEYGDLSLKYVGEFMFMQKM